MKYGIVLKEKEFTSGLTKSDIDELFELLDGNEVYPIELEAFCSMSSAMGFIIPDAAKSFNYEYEMNGLHSFIASILDDMNNETESHEYEFHDIKIYLSR